MCQQVGTVLLVGRSHTSQQCKPMIATVTPITPTTTITLLRLGGDLPIYILHTRPPVKATPYLWGMTNRGMSIFTSQSLMIYLSAATVTAPVTDSYTLSVLPLGKAGSDVLD
jgi:hypothetical protein